MPQNISNFHRIPLHIRYGGVQKSHQSRPSIIRIEADSFLAVSSFEYFLAFQFITIFRSLIRHALNRRSLGNFEQPRLEEALCSNNFDIRREEFTSHAVSSTVRPPITRMMCVKSVDLCTFHCFRHAFLSIGKLKHQVWVIASADSWPLSTTLLAALKFGALCDPDDSADKNVA